MAVDLSADEGKRPAAGASGSGSGVLLTETVGDVLRRQARVNGTRRAVLWEAGGELRALTYAQLLARAGAVARHLGDVVPGDRVAVWGRNCVEWVLLEYACALRGTVLVPFNTAWTDAEAAAAIELAGPALPVTAAGKIRRTQVKEEMSAPVNIPDSRSPSVTDRRTAGPGTR